MSDLSKQEIETFITDQYRLWSENRIDEMMALFHDIAPNGYTIEYVGAQPVEGEKAMADMIGQYAGKMQTKLLRLIVNGHEAAAVVDNVPSGGGEIIPSIETYRFENGKMHVRYYHGT